VGEICPTLDHFTDTSGSDFEARLQYCEKLLLALLCLPSVCLSLRMEQIGSHCTYFHIIFRKSVEKNNVLLNLTIIAALYVNTYGSL
jgi:hypothetical protein